MPPVMDRLKEGKSRRPERMDGYIRVSRRMGREGAGYLSPRIQREAIQRWADYRNVEIVTWHVDEDQSGGTQQRPGLRLAMQRTKAGETDGIACWRLNRFARNVSDALTDVGEIHAAGGSLACVEEDIDPTGPFGEFVLTVLLAVAALELNNAKAGWKTAKAEAMTRGAIIGPTPFGYRRRDDGTLEIDPVTGPVVTEAFRLASEESLHAATRYLLEHGEGRVWTTTTVRRLLRKRTYLGEFAYGDLEYSDPDLALVTPETWEAVARLPPLPKRRAAANYPLSGLVRCGTCGTHMVGGRGGKDRHTGRGLRVYRCAASMTAWRGERCTAPANTVADRLEAYVKDVAARAADELQADLIVGEPHEALDEAERSLEEAENALEAALADATLRGVLGERYHAHIEQLVTMADGASEHYRLTSARTVRPQRRVGLGDMIRQAQGEELAELFASMLASLAVEPGRGQLDRRVRFSTLDDLDV